MKRELLGFMLATACLFHHVLPAADTTPPQLVSLTLSSTNLEVTETSQTIFVMARITDDLSGMGSSVPEDYSGASVSCSFLSPSRKQGAGFGLTAIHRVSGNERDGVYTNAMVLPRYSESGMWTLQHASLRDAGGNMQGLDYVGLLRLGILAEFKVTGLSDTNPPECLSFGFSPDSVDLSSSNRVIQFSIRLRDDLSGIPSPPAIPYAVYDSAFANFRSPSGDQGFSVNFYNSGRASGDALDGVYTNAVILPEFREPGVWTLQSLSTEDAAGNQVNWSGGKLLALGFPLSLTVTGAGDTNPPSLVSFTLTPTNVNTTHSAGSITVTASVTDDFSGFGAVPFSSGGGVNATFLSPSGGQYAGVGLGPSFPFWEVARDAAFTNTLTLPRYAEPGVWLLYNLMVQDAAGNSLALDLAAVRNLGLPHSFVVEEFPRLEIVLSEDTAIVSWSAYASAFKLQTSSTAAGAAVWSDVSAAPVQFGERFFVASPRSVEQRFYRLVKRP